MNYLLSLKTICELEGVLGAFICDAEGRLVAREAPEMFLDEILTGVGKRMPAFFTASEKTIRGTEAVFLKFSVCQLLGVRLSSGSLNILCLDNAHLSALRIAASMVAQQIDTEAASSVPKNYMPIPERSA